MTVSATPPSTARDVVLVPGLWMPAMVMGLLAWHLARAGYRPRIFSYSGRDPLERNVERLAAFVRGNADGRAAHFVGHSLGGVVALETLERHGELAVASAVLLGAPVAGSVAGRHLGRGAFGRWLLGASAPLWKAERAARWTRDAPLGLIAGTRPLGMGALLLGAAPEPNDGVVTVAETAIEGARERVLVPVSHSGLVVSRRVARLVERFVAHGRFEEAAP